MYASWQGLTFIQKMPKNAIICTESTVPSLSFELVLAFVNCPLGALLHTQKRFRIFSADLLLFRDELWILVTHCRSFRFRFDNRRYWRHTEVPGVRYGTVNGHVLCIFIYLIVFQASLLSIKRLTTFEWNSKSKWTWRVVKILTGTIANPGINKYSEVRPGVRGERTSPLNMQHPSQPLKENGSDNCRDVYIYCAEYVKIGIC